MLAKLKIFSLILPLVFFVCDNFGQQFGGNPSSVKWRQINTDTARIIFPDGLDETAKRVASVIHELQQKHSSTIGNKSRKINIVLQNQTTVTNGYVGLGPFRSEFYLFAPQSNFELGALNWADMLSVHEFRHVQQFSNFKVGLAKAFAVVLGQEGQAVANAIAIPDWFFEGDAVFVETALTQQGRGKLPDFFKGYQSLLREGKKYSYMKLRNGSYRDFVPHHYPLGYMLVAYGREKYGADFWRRVSQDAAAFKPLIYPWQGAVERYSGVKFKKFVNQAFTFFNNQWEVANTSSVDYITPINKNNVTDYKYPYAAADGSLLVLKRGYRQIPTVYKINPIGKEEKITVRSIANDDYFSYNNGKIVFATYKPHARWGYKEFSDISIVDVATKATKKITHNQRYFSPDISHDGQHVVAVEMKTNQQSNVVVINTKGEKLFASSGTNGLVHTYPKFSTNDQFVYSAARDEDGKMALLKIEISSGKETILLPFQNRIIGYPTVQNDTIFFSSSYKGTNEIWAYVESKSQAYRVAINQTGFYQAAFQGSQNRLVASNFTADGYRLAALPASSLLWQPVDLTENALPDLYAANALQQESKTTVQNISYRNYQTKKYRKGYNLFNFHSWRPYYSDPEFSFTVYGQNILNTLQTELYYSFNQNDLSNRIGADAIYGGWFVQPTIGVSQTFNRRVLYNADTTFFYNEFNGRLGLRLPLNLSGGNRYRFLSLSSTFNNQQVNWTGLGKRLLAGRNFNFMDSRISFIQQVQKARQHIYPRFAQVLSAQYRSAVSKLTANQLLLNSSLYVPGLHVNHNLVLSASYHRRDTMNRYQFSNNFAFSRGYRAVDFPRMYKLAAEYHFPLLYPDWGFGNIVYLNRIRANAFYDYTQAKSLRTGAKFLFSSAGGEMYFDTKWWNQQEVTFGVRYSRILNNEFRGVTNFNRWEFILPVNLLN